jgi:hypothetical protein
VSPDPAPSAPGSPDAADATVLRIVPRRSLLVSALVSIVVILVPVSAFLYWFAIPRGQAPWVAVAQTVIVAAALVLLLRQLSVDTVVTGSELRGRGIFSPMVRVPLERIARVDLVPTFVGQYPDPVVQLLVRDAEGRRLFRLRGNYWRPGDLERVAAALPVRPTTAAEPIPLAEFSSAYPTGAYWFENRPIVVVLLVALAVAAAVGIAVGVLRLIDMPVLG